MFTRKLTFVLFLLVICGALVACGSESAEPETQEAPATTNSEATQPTKAAEPTEAPVPAEPRILRIPIQTQPASLNAILTTEESASHLHLAIYSTLTRIDPQTFVAAPYLAQDWEVSDDGLTWTFHLAENVKWHDGESFSADDVKFTYDLLRDETVQAPRRRLLASVTEIKVVDSTTVQFVLSQALMTLPDVLATTSLQIIPKHILEGQNISEATDFNTRNPVGTGPFKVKEVVEGSHIELEAFDDFFLGRPKIDGLIFRIVPDINTQVAQMRAGELDWFAIEPSAVAGVESDPTIVLLDTQPTRYIMLDMQAGPALDVLDEPEVRQALLYGLDRQAILDSVGEGRGVIQDSVLFAVPWAFNPSIEPYPYDPEKALELLASVGWEDSDGDGILDRDGEPLKFTITSDIGNPTREQVGLIMQEAYKALGMDVDFELLERGVYVEKVFDHTFHTRLTTRPAAAISELNRFYVTEASANYGLYSNADVDAALQAANATANREEQKSAYYDLQEAMYQDPPVLIMYYPANLIVHSANLENVPQVELLIALNYVNEISFK